MDKIIVISGGSRGIGLAIAQIFAHHGWTIFTAARSKEDIGQMRKNWEKDYPNSRLYAQIADLSTEKGCNDFISMIKTHTDRLNVLVNNVGQFSPGNLLDGSSDQLAQFFNVNILSAHYLTRGVRALLLNTPASKLFTIGSIAGHKPPPAMAAYALSKTALHAWHTAIREELLVNNIPAILIIPGATYTSSWKGVDVDPNDLLSPQQVAQLIWEHWEDNKTIEEVTILKD